MPHSFPLALLISTALVAQPASAAESAFLDIQNETVIDDDIVTYTVADENKAKKKGGKNRKSKTVGQRIIVRSSDDDDDEKDPKTALEIARKLGISNDDARPDKQFETTFLGKRLIVGGEISASARGRRHYDLELGADDDDIEFAPDATLEAIWLPSEKTAVFGSVKAFGQSELYKEGGGADTKGGVLLQNLWLLQTNVLGTPLAAQIGRQRMQDRREFWWDENIDAARLHYFGSDVKAFVGVGQVNGVYLSTLGRSDPEEKGLLRLFGNFDWKWSKRQHIELFAMHQNDRTGRYAIGDIIDRDDIDDRDANLTWLGVRASGCIKANIPRRICYWGDIARVSGSEIEYDLDGFNADNRIVDQAQSRKVRGWAFDIGASIELPFEFRPYLTIGYARGSGDRPGTPGRDGAFRQTGLHKNDGKFRGNSRFRYYGEVLRPNLSNIEISTAALGVPVTKHGWIETVWHRYRQPFADNRISGSRLGENPNGDNGKLGNEIDVILSYRPPSGWEFELTAGAFRSGSAFGNDAGRWAQLIELKIDYNF